MSRRLSRGIVVLAILGSALITCSHAVAWEFELEASFAWNWYSAWQTGPQGFFGPWDVDAAGQNLENQNFWAGANKWDGVFPHKHVSTNTQFMEFSPEIKINKAVRIRGNYYIGSRDDVNLDPAASEYLNSSAPGTLVAMSPGYWNQLWGSVQTPWGIVVAGKRPFTFGIGGLASGEDCTTTEALALVSPYGPMRYGFVIFPARRPGDASVGIFNADMGPDGAALFAPDHVVALQDENGGLLRNPHLAGFLTYSAGPLEMGALWEYARWYVGPESLIGQGLTAGERLDARNNYIPYDFTLNSTIFYLKYENGRFFFNAEADLMESMTRRQQPALGSYGGNTSVDNSGLGSGSLWQTGHVWAKRFYLESGAYVGPGKFTSLFGWIDGYDRRHGVLIDKQGTGLWLAPPRAGLASGFGLVNWFDECPNGIIFYPYSYLLVFNYGGGNNHFNVQGDGYLVDAVAYAARFDYSVAANLNVWGSFFYANRLSKGYGWGYIAPDGEGNVAYERLGTFDNQAPAIPDDNLGWEIGAGVDWQLLEGVVFASRFAYWQPGKWFNHACRSRNNANWDDPVGAGDPLWGTSANRTIDPVMGLEIVLGLEF